MIKYNYNFAKPDADMSPLYGPVPLAYDIPHHEEWDEPVIDPETGEPTGETEHMERDWTEHKTVLRPTAKDYLEAGYKPLYDTNPGLHEQGKHWERTGKIQDADTYYFWEYVLVDDPPPAPRVFSKMKCVAALTKAGLWEAVKSFIVSADLYDLYLAAQDFREDNEYFTRGKAALMVSLGLTEERVEELLSQCVAEGV